VQSSRPADGPSRILETIPHHPRVQLIEEMADGWAFMPTGRLISRFAALGWLDFYPYVDCMIDGFYETNGKGKYELGECLGTLSMLTFDISIG